MTFHVGQKVVCISDLAGQGPDGLRWPNFVRVGGVFTIRGIMQLGDYAGLHFEEYVAPLFHGAEPSFEAHRFRPVIERKTDISIFTAMLKTREMEREGTA